MLQRNRSNTRNQPYHRQVVQHIIPLIVVALAIFVLMGIYSSATNTLSNLRLIHENVKSEISNTYQDIISQAGNTLRETASRTETVLNSAAAFVVQNLSDPLRQNQALYHAMRLLDLNGNVQQAVINQNNLIIPILESTTLAEQPNFSRDPGFQSAKTATGNRFTLGQFRIERPEDFAAETQLYLSLYTPIFSGNERVGILQLELAGAPLIQEFLAINLRLGEGGTQHLFLVDHLNNIIIDSQGNPEEYLSVLETGIITTSTHRNLLNFLGNALPNFNLHLNDSLLLSSQTFGFDNALGSWKIVVATDVATVFNRTAGVALSIIALGGIIGGALAMVINRTVYVTLASIDQASEITYSLAQGEFRQRSMLETSEDDPLVTAVDQISNQIQALQLKLERETTRHQRDMQVAARIGREIATLGDIEAILQRAINLICTELGFYHAQVFMVDDARVNAVLVSSRGEAGQQMLARRHKLPVGSTSIIGTVTTTGQPLIINDTSLDTTGLHHANPDLPKTRAEMALPMVLGGQIIGALDIQSTSPHVFREEDLPTYQLIADQLTIAVQNTRLVQESEDRNRQITALNKQLTRSGWEDLRDSIAAEKGYSYNLFEINQVTDPPPTEGNLVTPIRIQDEVIGTLSAALPEGQSFSDGDQMILRAVSERVALALENRRLFVEAEEERQRLGAIMSTMPVGVMVLDPETYIPVLHNDQAERLLGRQIDYTTPFSASTYQLHRTGTNLLYPNEEMAVALAVETFGPVFIDDVAIINENMQTDLLVNAAPIMDNQGQITNIVVALQDISNLRNLENTLQENLRETVALYEAQRAFSEAETLDDVMEVMVLQLALFQPTDGYLLLADESGTELNLERYLIQPPATLEPFHQLLFNNRLIHIGDVQQEPALDSRAVSQFEAMNIRTVLAIPLMIRARSTPLGWLVAIGDEPDSFSLDQERTLTSVSDMATIAIDNRYLFQRTQEALQETNALFNATTTISRARDLDELAEAMQNAIQWLEPDRYAAYITASETGMVELFNMGFKNADGSPLNTDILLIETMGEDSTYIGDLTRTTLRPLERELLRLGDIEAFAAVNLRVKDVPSGRLLVGYKSRHIFTETQIQYLNSIADSASVIVDNQLLFNQIQSSLNETSVLYQSSRALAQASSPEEIVQVVSNYLIGHHVSHVFMALLNNQTWDAENATVQVVANWHDEGGVNLQGVTLTADQFPAWSQLASPTVTTISDVEDETNGLSLMERTGIESLDARSVVIIPLRVLQRPIGSIWIGSREPYEYSPIDVRIFQAFSEQASISMEAAHLLEQTQHRARQLETSAYVGRRAGQILDLDSLLPELVDLIKEQFGYEHVQIFLMDADNEYAMLHASTGEAGRQLLAISHKLQRGSDSVIGRVTETGDPTIALDTADANVVHQPNPYLPLTRSELALPLIVKGKVAGALDVQSNQPNAFNDEDVRALGALAAQIAVTIDNAQLYEQSQARAADMTFLFDVTTVAAAADSLDESLQSVAERLRDSLGMLSVTAYLPQLYVDNNENTFTMIQPVAVAGSDQPLSEISEVRPNDSENIIGIVSSTLQPQVVGEIHNEIRYIPIVEEARSALVVPINTGMELVGILVLEHMRLNAFSHDTVQLMVTLAGSITAIIQNTKLVEQLQKTNEQLREVDRLKSEFLANMSHELRTPLNSIIGFSRVMLKGIDGPLTEMQEQDLSTIYNSGQHLLTLINDLLDQAKIAANKMELKLAFFDVKPMVESVKSIAIGLVKEKPVDLIVEIAPNLAQAYGDEFRTRQILLNLVNNAAKFTTEGSISVLAYMVKDEVNDQSFVRIDVSDTGIGIAEKDIPLLFEAFRQIDSSLTRTVGGTGLGLPIAKSLAEMQGGALTVESEINVGSTFSVFIPIEQTVSLEDDEEEDTQPKRVDTLPPPEQPSLKVQTTTTKTIMPKQRLVLLIEDNKNMVDQFRRTLQREGFEVQTADHPAYAEAMASNLRPTVIVMDVNFADGKGWEILKQLKERDDTFDIPIVINTISSDSEQAYMLGAHTFMQRPFMPEELTEAVLKAEQEGNRERILIIDDEPESVRLIEQLLIEHGHYRVFSADNGKEGISLVARRRPDLVILDLRMPGTDGFTVLEELRGNPETATIPVLVVTGDPNLNSSEQKMLSDLPVMQKTDITMDTYDHFLNHVVSKLTAANGEN